MIAQHREVSRFGPHGVTILLVDSDSTCLAVISKMLSHLGYTVMTSRLGLDAFCIIQEKKSEVDLILADGNLPDVDKYEFLEMMGQVSKLPVVITISDDDVDVMVECFYKGAEYCYAKPLAMADLENLWQSVPGHDSTTDGSQPIARQVNITEEPELVRRSLGKRKLEETDGDAEEDSKYMAVVTKKPRVVWKGELHKKFLCAIRELGPAKAMPKKIMQHMNVPGLTTVNISSHLQKYRKSLKQERAPFQRTYNGVPAAYVPLPSLNQNPGFSSFPNSHSPMTASPPPAGGFAMENFSNDPPIAQNIAGSSRSGPALMIPNSAGDFQDNRCNTNGQGSHQKEITLEEYLMINDKWDASDATVGTSGNHPTALDTFVQGVEQEQELEELRFPELPPFPEPQGILIGESAVNLPTPIDQGMQQGQTLEEYLELPQIPEDNEEMQLVQTLLEEYLELPQIPEPQDNSVDQEMQQWPTFEEYLLGQELAQAPEPHAAEDQFVIECSTPDMDELFNEADEMNNSPFVASPGDHSPTNQ